MASEWLPPATTQENTFVQMRIVDDRSETRSVNVTSTGWVERNGVSDCTLWSPDASNSTGNVNQTRTCQKVRSNTYTYTANGAAIHTRIKWDKVPVTESRVYLSRGDKIIGETTGVWSAWLDKRELSCGSPSPDPSLYSAAETYMATYSCQVEQSSYLPIYNVWASGKKTTKTTQYRSRNITKSVIKPTKGYNTGDNAWTLVKTDGDEWVDTGNKSCGSVFPLFSQEVDHLGWRSCTINQEREVWDVYKHNQKGTLQFRNFHTETQPRSFREDIDVKVVLDAWKTQNSTCSSYAPEIKDQVSSFSQTQSCSRTQVRNRAFYVADTTANRALGVLPRQINVVVDTQNNTSNTSRKITVVKTSKFNKKIFYTAIINLFDIATSNALMNEAIAICQRGGYSAPLNIYINYDTYDYSYNGSTLFTWNNPASAVVNNVDCEY